MPDRWANMPERILPLPDELPDDIEAIITYNDGVHYQLVLKRPQDRVSLKRVWDYGWSWTDENGVLYGTGGFNRTYEIREPQAIKSTRLAAFRSKQGRIVRAFMRPRGRKVA